MKKMSKNFVVNKDIKVGDGFSLVKQISENDVMKFADLTGDYNPIHIDESVAKKSRFGKRVAQGMLCGSLISTVLGMYFPGPGTIYLEQSFRFVAPVFLGDSITAEVKIKDIIDGKAILYTTITNQYGKMVLLGEAKVLLP